MSRSTQFVGLNGRAEALLEPGEICKECKRPFSEYRPVPGKYKYHGMFDDDGDLPGYIPKPGLGPILYEKVQASPWSSGPVIFTALVDEHDNWVKESLWTEEEIEEQT